MSTSRQASRALNRPAPSKRGSTPDERAKKARLNPYKGRDKSDVAYWVWNQLSKTKHAEIFGERFEEVAKEIARTSVSQAAMDLIVGTEGLNDLSCLGLRGKVEHAEFSIMWRENRFSALAGSGGEHPGTDAGEPRKFLGHQQSAAANFLRSEFEAYDERTLVSTLVFGVATSLFATVISGLDWYSRELDTAGEGAH